VDYVDCPLALMTYGRLPLEAQLGAYHEKFPFCESRAHSSVRGLGLLSADVRKECDGPRCRYGTTLAGGQA